MNHAVMMLANPFRPDPRVLKEARSLAEVGHRLTILAWDRQKEYPPRQALAANLEVVRVQHVPSSYGIGAQQIRPLLRFWKAALHLLDELQPDLIHCHDFDTLPAGLYWGKRHDKPVIYDAHEYYADLVSPRLIHLKGRFYFMAIRNLERFCASRADAIITVDQSLAHHYQPLNRNVLIIGHYPSRKLAAKPTSVFTHPEITLLYLGRLSRDRGLWVYLDVLRRLRAAVVPSKLILAGVFTPADERSAFLTAAQDLQDSLQILDWVPYEDIPTLLNQADIGLTLLQPDPRYVAALPVKLFEYMAAGRPVLASDFPLVRQVVESAHCGALLDPGDSQAAVATLQEWLAHPEHARRMGENGRQAVLHEYNWESLAESLTQLYSSLLR